MSIQDAGKLQIFGDDECRPYVDAVHCYAKKPQSKGRNGGGGETRVEVEAQPQAEARKAQPQAEARKAQPQAEAPRYRIVLRGLKSYRGVDDSLETQLLRLMSQTRNPITDNIDGDNVDQLSTLRRMQVYTSSEEAATEWFTQSA